MKYQLILIGAHYSGKASVTFDALFLLEHAAGHHSTGETEDTQSYG